MRIPIPKSYDRVMDWIAVHIMPPPKPVCRIGGHQIDQVELALAGYTVVLGIGLALAFGSWLWLPATIACMIFTIMLYEWFF